MVGGLANCPSDSGFRIRIGIDKGSGHTRAAGHSSDADRCLLPAQARDRFADAAERDFGMALPGRQRCRSAGFGSFCVGHAEASVFSLSLGRFSG